MSDRTGEAMGGQHRDPRHQGTGESFPKHTTCSMVGDDVIESEEARVRRIGRPGYGPIGVHMRLVAEFWSSYLTAKAGILGYDRDKVRIAPDDVPRMMQLLKIARSCTGAYKPDNQTDITGWGNLDTWLNEPHKLPDGLKGEV